MRSVFVLVAAALTPVVFAQAPAPSPDAADWPMYNREGGDRKQYVAVVAAGASALDDPAPAGSEALVVFALP